MDDTKMNRKDLIKILRKNRKKHKKEFVEARLEWRKKATRALQKAADKAKSSNGEKITEWPLAKLPKPTHHLHSYDDLLVQLEMEVRDTVTLTPREIRSYVQDIWEWHDQWVGTQSLYSNAS